MQVNQIKTLQLEITSYCNAQCPHCPRFTPDGDLDPTLVLDHWSFDSVRNNFELFKMTSLNHVIIQGDKGDPAMHPEALEITEFFVGHHRSPGVHFNTNGSIRNEKFWRSMAGLGPTLQVTFSIDGLKDTNHIYRVNVDWDKAMKNAKAFISAGGRAIWKCLIFKHNQHQIAEISRLAEEMGFEAVTFLQPLLNRFTPTWFSDKTQWPIYQRGQYVGELLPSDMDRQSIESYSRDFNPYKKLVTYQRDTLNYVCPNLMRGHLYVTYRHHVLPCCMMHNYLYERDRNPNSARMLDELVRDVDSIDISKRDLSLILSSDFYSHNLEDHFVSGEHLPVCEKSCHREIAINLAKKHQ